MGFAQMTWLVGCAGLAVALMGASGCSESKTPDADPPSAAAASGEADVPKAEPKAPEKPALRSRLLGTWGIDQERLVDTPQFRGLSEVALKAAIGRVSELLGDSTFEFTETLLITRMRGQETRAGYTVQSEEDGSLTLLMEGTTKKREVRVDFVGDERIFIHDATRHDFPLIRKR